jgi:hypothetical protein
MSAQYSTTTGPTAGRLSGRKVAAAWIMGGGIWLLGMFALMVVPMIATDVNAHAPATQNYYAHSGSWKTVTDASGKYSAVVRQMVQAPKY